MASIRELNAQVDAIQTESAGVVQRVKSSEDERRRAHRKVNEAKTEAGRIRDRLEGIEKQIHNCNRELHEYQRL